MGNISKNFAENFPNDNGKGTKILFFPIKFNNLFNKSLNVIISGPMHSIIFESMRSNSGGVCGEKFQIRADYTHHMNRHHGEKSNKFLNTDITSKNRNEKLFCKLTASSATQRQSTIDINESLVIK